MNEILRAVRQAGLRLSVTRFLETFVLLLCVSAGIAIAARLAQQVLGAPIPWREVATWFAPACAVLALAWTIIRRESRLSIARQLDERADLRETLSTALCVAPDASKDPWAKVILASARERAVSIEMAKAIPIQAPRNWAWAAGLGIGFVVVWFSVGKVDLFGQIAKQKQRETDQRQIVQAKAEAQLAEQKLEELLKRAGVEVKDDKGGDAAEEGRSPESAEEIRRAAVKRLESASERLKELRSGEAAQEQEAFKKALEQLRQPGDGPLNDFARQLAQGDFAKASQSLSELGKQLASSDMPETEKAKAAEQMKQLAKQLEKISKDTQRLSKELMKQGLDPKTASELAKKMLSDPEAVKKALEQMKNLTPEQKQQMMEQAQAMQQAASKAENMSKAMDQMSQGMGKEGMSQQGQQGEAAMQQQLSELEMAQSDLESLEQAMSEIKGQIGQLCEGMGQCEGDNSFLAWRDAAGEWSEGDSLRQGAGSGSAGQGMGAGPEENPADYKVDKVKANVKTGKGSIIGTRLVQGEQVRGESVAEFAEAVEASSKAAAEAVNENVVPREYQNAIKHYFGRLNEAAKREGGAAKSGETKSADTKQDDTK
ncbi:MAG: hypothetical protein SFZ23_08250 [Planctomycetota bacterium]|nr:hypothetical protein [Planctomycetota bacterium]